MYPKHIADEGETEFTFEILGFSSFDSYQDGPAQHPLGWGVNMGSVYRVADLKVCDAPTEQLSNVQNHF